MYNRIKHSVIFLLLASGVFASQIVFAENSPAHDQAEFQDWLKHNGQPVLAQNTASSPVQQIQMAQAASSSPSSQPQTAQDTENNSPAVTSSAVQVQNGNQTQTILPQINPLPSNGSNGQNTQNPPPTAKKKGPLTFEESQQIMRNSAPPSPPPSSESNAAFNSMMQKNMPLSPEQVVRLRQLIDVSQRAAAIPANVPPKPVSSTLIVNLAPGTTPPAIRLSQGYVSSLVFVDSSGSPWPIDSFDVGDPKATNVQWDPKSNVLLMQAISPYSDSNLVVKLTGLPTPVTLELVSGQRVVDYRVDIHVSGIGPNTKDLPTGVALPNSANQLLLNVLDGVAPPGSKLLTVTGGDCQAWSLGNKMYLRTRFAVLSPGWIGKMVSPDGMNAYEMQKTSSVLVSQYGEPIELKIEGL